MTTISTAKVPSKRTIKRKLDDSILKKARAALGLPLDSGDIDDDQEKNDEPSLKWRKPRHNTAEGQIYIKNKEKRKELDAEQSSRLPRNSLSVSKVDDKKIKKKRKKKKKRKTTGDEEHLETVTKNADSEKKHSMEAIAYLQLWASNRDHWKFEKRKQTWLLKNCLNASLIDDERFDTLLEYIASVKGAARQATIDEMQNVVKQREEVNASHDAGDEVVASTESKSIDLANENETMYHRARQIIQMLVD